MNILLIKTIIFSCIIVTIIIVAIILYIDLANDNSNLGMILSGKPKNKTIESVLEEKKKKSEDAQDPEKYVGEVKLEEDAVTFAMSKWCSVQGYDYDPEKNICAHTKQTCLEENENNRWVPQYNKCVQTMPYIKDTCDSIGLPYYEPRMECDGNLCVYEEDPTCIINPGYAREKRVSHKNAPYSKTGRSLGDTYTSDGQAIMEMVFGTTLTRYALAPIYECMHNPFSVGCLTPPAIMLAVDVTKMWATETIAGIKNNCGNIGEVSDVSKCTGSLINMIFPQAWVIDKVVNMLDNILHLIPGMPSWLSLKYLLPWDTTVFFATLGWLMDGGLADLGGAIFEGMVKFGEGFVEACKIIGEGFAIMAEGVAEAINVIGNIGKAAVGAIIDWGKKGFDAMVKYGAVAINVLSNIGEAAWDILTNLDAIAMEAVSAAIEWGIDAANYVADIAKEGLKAATKAIVDVLGTIGALFLDSIADIGGAIADLAEEMADAIEDALSDAAGAVGDFFDSIF